MESDFVYIGIISSYSKKHNFFVLKDNPPEFPSINQEIEVLIGFSIKFAKKYKIKNIENRKTSMRVYLPNTSKVDFNKFLRMGVYIDRKSVQQFKAEYFGPEDLLDALVYDQNDNCIGKVADVHILPTQFVLYVDSDTYTIPLPFSKEILMKFDLKNKIIILDLPENYLDLAEFKG